MARPEPHANQPIYYRWPFIVACVAALLLLSVGVPHALVYVEWRNEQAALSDLDPYRRGMMVIESGDPMWPFSLLGRGYAMYFERVHFLAAHGATLNRRDAECIAALKGIESLDLSGSDADDEDVAHVCGLPRLAYLNLSDTRVTDASVGTICRMEGLLKLYLIKTKVSEEGVRRISAALPRVSIVR